MKLFVLRHGIAEDQAGGPDSQRALTDDGRKKLRKVLATAKQAGLQPDYLLSSPYVRAVQTADEAAKALGFDGDRIETDRLLPYSNVLELWDELRDYQSAQQVLIVGHNPQLSELVCTLLGAGAWGVQMKKAAMACLEVTGRGPQPQATLCWLLTAKIAAA